MGRRRVGIGKWRGRRTGECSDACTAKGWRRRRRRRSRRLPRCAHPRRWSSHTRSLPSRLLRRPYSRRLRWCSYARRLPLRTHSGRELWRCCSDARRCVPISNTGSVRWGSDRGGRTGRVRGEDQGGEGCVAEGLGRPRCEGYCRRERFPGWKVDGAVWCVSLSPFFLSTNVDR